MQKPAVDTIEQKTQKYLIYGKYFRKDFPLGFSIYLVCIDSLFLYLKIQDSNSLFKEFFRNIEFANNIYSKHLIWFVYSCYCSFNTVHYYILYYIYRRTVIWYILWLNYSNSDGICLTLFVRKSIINVTSSSDFVIQICTEWLLLENFQA